MKYMLMMQFPLSAWRTSRIELWPPQDAKAHMHYLHVLNKELVASGEFVETHGLSGPEAASVVAARDDGEAEVSDGPFTESKEFLAGYIIVDVPTRQRAQQIAARWSAGPGPGGKPLNFPVEVRPILQHAPQKT